MHGYDSILERPEGMFTQNYVAIYPASPVVCSSLVIVSHVNTECTVKHSVTLSLLLASLEARKHITFSAWYVYYLVLAVYSRFLSWHFAKNLAVPNSQLLQKHLSKLPGQYRVVDICKAKIAWARCHHYETESTLRTNRVHHFRSVT